MSTPTHEVDRFIRRDEVTDLVGIKPSRIYELIQEGRFPRQIRIGGAARWSLMEIIKWQDERRNDRRVMGGGAA